MIESRTPHARRSGNLPSHNALSRSRLRNACLSLGASVEMCWRPRRLLICTTDMSVGYPPAFHCHLHLHSSSAMDTAGPASLRRRLHLDGHSHAVLGVVQRRRSEPCDRAGFVSGVCGPCGDGRRGRCPPPLPAAVAASAAVTSVATSGDSAGDAAAAAPGFLEVDVSADASGCCTPLPAGLGILELAVA